MDAGTRTRSLRPLHSRDNLDRFIPNRSATDMDFAQYMLFTAARKGKENQVEGAPSTYRKLLAETLNMNRTRILAFKDKPPAPVELFPEAFLSERMEPTKPRRSIPQAPEKTLDAPELANDYYLNLLDWGSSNILGSTPQWLRWLSLLVMLLEFSSWHRAQMDAL